MDGTGQSGAFTACGLSKGDRRKIAAGISVVQPDEEDTPAWAPAMSDPPASQPLLMSTQPSQGSPPVHPPPVASPTNHFEIVGNECALEQDAIPQPVEGREVALPPTASAASEDEEAQMTSTTREFVRESSLEQDVAPDHLEKLTLVVSEGEEIARAKTVRVTIPRLTVEGHSCTETSDVVRTTSVKKTPKKTATSKSDKGKSPRSRDGTSSVKSTPQSSPASKRALTSPAGSSPQKLAKSVAESDMTNLITASETETTEIQREVRLHNVSADDSASQGFRELMNSMEQIRKTLSEMKQLHLQQADSMSKILSCVLPPIESNISSKIPRLPMNSKGHEKKMNDLLKSTEEFNKVVSFLHGLGGTGVRDAVYSAMKSLFSDEYASTKSMKGTKRVGKVPKTAFQGTLLFKAVTCAVRRRFKDTTVSDVIEVTANWLKDAPSREKKRLRRKEAREKLEREYQPQ